MNYPYKNWTLPIEEERLIDKLVEVIPKDHHLRSCIVKDYVGRLTEVEKDILSDLLYPKESDSTQGGTVGVL